MCACACSSSLGRAGWPSGCGLWRLTLPVAVLSFFVVRPPLGWGCPCFGCLFVFFFLFVGVCSFPSLPTSPLAPRLSLAFSASRPWVPWALVLFVCSSPPTSPPLFAFVPSPFFPPPLSRPRCLQLFVLTGPGCSGPWRSLCAPPPPPIPSFFFFCFWPPPAPLRASLVLSSPSLPALGALGLGALFPPAPAAISLSLCFFVCVPSFPWFWALLVLLASGVRAVCCSCAPPPPRPLLVFRCVRCLVVLCRGLLLAVLCGWWRFAVFLVAMWCWCPAVWSVVVLCCWSWRWLVPVGADPPFLWGVVLFCAVFGRVSCRRTLLCGVLCCVLSLCALWSGRPVHRVVWNFPAFPPPLPCCCPLLPLPGLLSWLIVVFVLGCGAVLVCCAA